MLPAVGQGALAIEIRTKDLQLKKLLLALDHPPTTIAVTAERALLKHLEGGCQIPIGAYGRIHNNELHLDAVIGSLDGKKIVRGNLSGSTDQASQLGVELAQRLLLQGGKEILEDIRNNNSLTTP
jgi:hydroxymethylbilane synthase